MLRTTGVFIITAALMATMTACALSPDADRGKRQVPSDEPSSSKLDDPSDPSATPATEEASLASDLINPHAGCSVVQFCDVPSNLPNGSDGARCLQQGCSIGAAEKECETETRQICGTPKCPFIFVTSSGARLNLCASNSCVGTNSCGGRAPAGCFCDAICVDPPFDCCPDGPC